MKLLACALDGTLVETEKNFIRKDNIEAIKKLRKEGHKFICFYRKRYKRY